MWRWFPYSDLAEGSNDNDLVIALTQNACSQNTSKITRLNSFHISDPDSDALQHLNQPEHPDKNRSEIRKIKLKTHLTRENKERELNYSALQQSYYFLHC